MRASNQRSEALLFRRGIHHAGPLIFWAIAAIVPACFQVRTVPFVATDGAPAMPTASALASVRASVEAPLPEGPPFPTAPARSTLTVLAELNPRGHMGNAYAMRVLVSDPSAYRAKRTAPGFVACVEHIPRDAAVAAPFVTCIRRDGPGRAFTFAAGPSFESPFARVSTHPGDCLGCHAAGSDGALLGPLRGHSCFQSAMPPSKPAMLSAIFTFGGRPSGFTCRELPPPR